MRIFDLSMRYIFFVFLSLLTCKLIGQSDDADSLRKVWTDQEKALSERFQAIDLFYRQNTFDTPQKALDLSYVHEEIAKESADGYQIAKAINCRAIAYAVMGENDRFMETLEAALHATDTIDAKMLRAGIYTNMGTAERESSRLQKAIDHYNNSLEIFTELGNPDDQADLLNNIGLVYRDVRELDLAYEYLDSARVLYKKAGTLEENGNVWLNMASIHFAQKRFDEALKLIRKSITSHQNQNNTLALGDSYRVIAEIFSVRSEMDSALFYAIQSRDIHQNLGNLDRAAQVQILLAELYEEEYPAMANAIIVELERTLPELANKEVISEVYRLLYESAKQNGDAERALAMNENYRSYSDSLQIEEQRIALIRQSMNETFEEELSKEQRSSQVEKEELERKQFSTTAIIVLLSLAAIGLLVVLMRKRQKKQEKEKLHLLSQIEELRNQPKAPRDHPEKDQTKPAAIFTDGFQLDRAKVEKKIEKELNETDWNVLELLAKDPVMSNKELSEKAFISVDGIGSSLRRMYVYFEVKESKYKKISLILEAIKVSNAN